MKRLSVATGGRPHESLTKALASLELKAGVHSVAVAHDNGCPCAEEQKPTLFCTCEIIEVIVR